MSRSETLNDDKGTQVSVQPKEPAQGGADMKTEHISSEDGRRHRIDIDGLNVWIFRDGAQWIAHGIEIDYAVAAETQGQAKSLFSVGLMMSLIENVRRFGNVDRFISKRAPREIEEAWLRAKQGLLGETEPLQLPQAEFGEPQEKLGVPPQVHYYKEAA